MSDLEKSKLPVLAPFLTNPSRLVSMATWALSWKQLIRNGYMSWRCQAPLGLYQLGQL